MVLTLSPWAALSLFVAMAAMAAVPSLSVLLVASRAVAHGMRDAAAAAFGIVLADIAFIMLALFGLSLLQQTSPLAFTALKIAGALWLVMLAWQLSRPTIPRSAIPHPPAGSDRSGSTPSHYGALVMGFVLTIGDQKAVLFYLGFMPAFIDIESLTAADAVIIALIALVAVGGTKLLWAWGARRATSTGIASAPLASLLRRVASILLLLAAGQVLYRVAAEAATGL
jgi:threonine/homoserine/homoserine lactone efflux protein